jgi:hypothetical protein
MADQKGSLPDKHFWLISVPKRDKGEDVFTELNRKTVEMQNVSEANYKFEIPELRVGTLDTLMTLSDELNKIDMYVEGVVKKVGRQTLDLVKEKRTDAKFEVNEGMLLVYPLGYFISGFYLIWGFIFSFVFLFEQFLWMPLSSTSSGRMLVILAESPSRSSLR